MVSKQSAKNTVLRAMANAYILQERYDTVIKHESSKDDSTALSLIDILKNKSIEELSFMAKILGKKRIKKCISSCDLARDKEFRENLTSVYSEINKK